MAIIVHNTKRIIKILFITCRRAVFVTLMSDSASHLEVLCHFFFYVVGKALSGKLSYTRIFYCSSITLVHYTCVCGYLYMCMWLFRVK